MISLLKIIRFISAVVCQFRLSNSLTSDYKENGFSYNQLPGIVTDTARFVNVI